MFRLNKEASFEEIIKKSRFIAIAKPVANAQEAMEFFQTNHHSDANHNCWAYKIGPQEYRFNDDGEPGGTAGKPILQAIESKELLNTAVLVIRYFGGIKLGTGGLIRAYGGAAAKCLQEAPRSEIIPSTEVFCKALYQDIDLIKAKLIIDGIKIEEETFTNTGVDWKLDIPDTVLEQAAADYINLTRGHGVWEVIKEDL